MAIFGYDPIDQELNNYNLRKTRESQFKAVRKVIEEKPEIGENLEDLTNKHGNILPRDILIGGALMGFKSDNPEIAALINRQLEIESENQKKFAPKARAIGRGLVRSAFVGMDSLAEYFVKRPFQAGARTLIDAGKSPMAAWGAMFGSIIGAGQGDELMFSAMGLGDEYRDNLKKLGPTQAGRAIRQLAKGETVNLGEGYFGNSTLAKDTEIYKEIAAQIQDPEQLAEIENVIQQQLGAPITAIEREAVEGNLYKGVTISPGRVTAMNLAEPGTDRYKFLSGLIDGVVTLGLDPANLVGGWAVRMTSKGRKFKVAELAEQGAGMAKARRILEADVFQKVRIKDANGNVVIRHADVGSEIIDHQKIYTWDEVRELSRKGGNTGNKNIWARNKKGKVVTSNVVAEKGGAAVPADVSIGGKVKDVSDLKYRPFGLGLQKTTLANNRYGSRHQIFIDNELLQTERIFEVKKAKDGSKYLQSVGNAKYKIDDPGGNWMTEWSKNYEVGDFVTNGSGMLDNGMKFKSADEALDFILAHEAEHILNYRGLGTKATQKLYGKRLKAARAFGNDKEVRALHNEVVDLHKQIDEILERTNFEPRANDLRRVNDYTKKINKIEENIAKLDLTMKSEEALLLYEKGLNESVYESMGKGLITHMDGKEIFTGKKAAGLSSWVRPSLNKTIFEEWHIDTGKKIYNFLHDNIQKGGLNHEDLRRIMPDVSVDMIDDMLTAGSADEIGDLIAKEVRAGNISKRLDPYSFTFKGGASKKIGKYINRNNKLVDDGGRIDFSDMGDFLGVGAVARRKASDSKLFRLFKEIAPGNINTHSHVLAFQGVEKLVRSLPFSKKQKGKIYKDLANASRRMNISVMDGQPYSKIRLTEEMYNILLGSKDDPGGILDELTKLLAAKGHGKEVSNGVTKFIAEIRDARKYWVGLVGDEVIDVAFTGAKSKPPSATHKRLADVQQRIDELDELTSKGTRDEIEDFIYRTYDGDAEVAQPTAQLMTEMMTGNIPLPDMGEVYRILGSFRNNLYSLTGLNKLPFMPKRIDLPQILDKENKFIKLVDNVYDDDFAIAARKNKEFAEFLTGWKYPTLSDIDTAKIKNPRKHIEKLQQKARDELYENYKRITGNERPQQYDGDILSVFGQLDEVQMIQDAANAGNIVSNALTRRLARVLYKRQKTGAAADEYDKLVNTALTRYANNAVTQLWKPLQLLRFAWTARVISEEQLRMYAADLDNVWTSPISLFAYAFGQKASKDVLGGDIKMSLLHDAAMSRGSQGIMMRKSTSIDRFYDIVRKKLALGDSASRGRYAQGWSTEITHLAEDDMAVEIAKILSGVKGKNFDTMDDLADFLVNPENLREDLYRVYQDWGASGDLISGPMRKQIVSDKDRTLEFLEGVAARITDKTGGSFRKYILKDGKKIEIPLGASYKSKDGGLPLRMYYEIVDSGNKEIIEGIATGRVSFFQRVDDSGEEVFRQINLKNMSDNDYKALKAELGRRAELGPEVVKVSRRLDKTALEKTAQGSREFVEKMFNLFMSAPTNKLSRSPAFKQFYWRHVADAADRLDPRALESIIDNARKAKVNKKVIKELEQATGQIGGYNLNNLNDFDELMKAAALTDVEELLYNLNKRSEFSQALELLFPFAEVHKEIAGTWTRLIRENPTKLRKMQITVDSLKESDPTNFDAFGGDSSDDSQAFIYTDPLTGEEIYTIPVVDTVFNNMFQKISNVPGSASADNIDSVLQGSDENLRGLMESGFPKTGADVRMRTVGFTSSANIVAGGIIPGVGPAIQIPAKYLLPNDKEKDAIYQTIFPYGEPETVLDSFIPSWLKKVIGAFDAGPESWRRQYTNAAKDILKAKILSGQIVINDENDMLEALKIIKRQATIFTVLRGVTQGVSLTGGSFRFEAAVSPEGEMYMNPALMRERGLDPDGRYFAFNVLASQYYRMYAENNGDNVKTTQQFADMFGYDPTALLISKSKEIIRTPYTIDNIDYSRTNKTMQYAYEKYTDVAYYLSPDIPIDEFSYKAFIESFDDDNISGYTARYDLGIDEWAALYNVVAGKFAMENFRRAISDPSNTRQYIASSKLRDEMIFRANKSLEEIFPGYGVKPRTASPTDYESLEKQLRKMVRDPNIYKENREFVETTNIYLASLDAMRSSLESKTGTRSKVETNFFSYTQRQALENKAKELYTQYPQWIYIWEDVFRPQLQEDQSKLLLGGSNLP